MTKRLLQACTCVFALSLLLILPVASHAQAVYGSITGTVTDPTGAAIPNATITVTDEQKGTSVTATSNGSGEFTIDHMIVDNYDIKIEAAGFKGYEAKGIQVYVDTAAKVTAALQVGTASQTVEVSADAIPVLKTDRADVATVFDSKDVQDLPLFGGTRNFTSLQLLLPGAQILGWSHASDENPQGSQQIQVDGQAFGGVAYELDGTDNQDPILGIIVINPPLDALSEAKITTQNFDAEFGKAVSSVVIASTKSGTNSFHGSAFDFRKGVANQATDPFTQAQPTSGAYVIPPGLYSQFGGSVGGPIIKDKLFFFGDYQGVRQKVSTPVQTTLPSEQVLSTCLGQATGPSGIPGCDFSQYLVYNGAPGPGNPATFNGFATYGVGTIYQNVTNPNGSITSTPYPNNTIPAAQLTGPNSAPALNFLTQLQNYVQTTYGNYATQPYYQSGNNTSALFDNFNESGNGLFNNNQWDARVDYQLSEKMHAFGRFSRFTDVLTGGQIFGPNLGGSGFGPGQPGYGGQSTGANDSAAAGMDFALKPSLLTDFRLGYYRYNIGDEKNNQAVDFMNQLGIPGENTSDPLTGGTGEFEFALPGNGTQDLYGSGLAVSRCNCPLTEREDQFQIVNNWTKVWGNHSIKFGADLRYARNLRVPSDADRVGQNSFGAGPTGDITSPTGSNGSLTGVNSGGNGFASFVLGQATQLQRYVSTVDNAKEFQKRTFFYGQDTWRLTPNFTLNYGLRYELYFPETVNGVANGGLMNLKTGFTQVAGVGPFGSNMNWSPDKVAFSPRVGFAYQLNPKTVIRSGYGRSYDIGVFGSIFGHNVTQNLPVLADQNTGCGGATCTAFTLSQGPPAYQFPTQAANFPNGLLSTPGYNVTPKTRPDPLQMPRIDAWNFAIQRSITPTMSLTMQYVGNKGTHTLVDGDGNNTNPDESAIFLPAQFSVIPGVPLHWDPSVSGTATYPGSAIPGISPNGGTANLNYLTRFYGGQLPACAPSTGYTQPNGLLPAGACGWTNSAGIADYADALDTHFNALQVIVAKQLQHGLSFTANYQWARAFDYEENYVTWNKVYAYGRDSAVREQQLTLYGLYQLPFGRQGWIGQNAPGWVDKIIGHFELSGTLNWAGGEPFTLGLDNCSNIPGSGGGGGAPCYPNTNGQRLPLHLGSFSTSAHNRSYFAPLPGLNQSTPVGGFTLPALDTIGNNGRNNYFGPTFWNSDMSIQKNIPIHEAIAAQFRFDAFNAFNHINPGNPNSTSIQSGGNITAEAPGGVPRYLAFTLRVIF